MQFPKFKKNYSSLVESDRIKTFINIVLVGSLLIALFMLFDRKERVIIVPPTLAEKAWVQDDAASIGYKKAWGLFAANMMGNINPGNIDFIQESLQDLMSVRVYQRIKKVLIKQSKTIKEDNLVLYFHARGITHEKESDKVFVYGEITTVGAGGAKNIKKRTYEFKISIINFTPKIVKFSVYSGEPRTMKWIRDNAKK